MQRSLIIALVIILLVVILAVQNSDIILVKFFFWSFDGSLALVMFVTLIIGSVLGMLFSIPGLRKRNHKIEELKKELAGKQSEKTDKNITG